jgi:hypothetical protein
MHYKIIVLMKVHLIQGVFFEIHHGKNKKTIKTL